MLMHGIWAVSALCCYFADRKILELEEELKVVGNAMKSLEIFEQEVSNAF